MADQKTATGKSLAIMTFGISHLQKKASELEVFYPKIPMVISAAKNAPGFGVVQPSLGKKVHPRFYDATCRDLNREVSQVLFLWENIEAVLAFSYRGVHREALNANKANSWFVHKKWPAYVAWWTTLDEVSWNAGCRKLEQLFDDGSTPEAFNFQSPFGVDGTDYSTDRARLKHYQESYA